MKALKDLLPLVLDHVNQNNMVLLKETNNNICKVVENYIEKNALKFLIQLIKIASI